MEDNVNAEEIPSDVIGAVDNHFARLTFDGERFSGARLPIDALVELQRYRELVLESARLAWISKNPGTPLPDDFAQKFDLAITDVEVGSAESVLDFPTSVYDEYYALGRDQLEAAFAEIINSNFDAQLLVAKDGSGDPRTEEQVQSLERVEPLTELYFFPAFQNFGSSLHSEETINLPQTRTRESISATSAMWRSAIEPIVETLSEPVVAAVLPTTSKKYESTVAGRLIALNAEKHNFTISTLHFGEVNGRYSEDDMTAELKAVLNSSAQAPLVRVSGKMSWRDGQLYRILDVKDVELLEIDAEPWSRRVVELASMPPNWHPELDASPVISFVAIDAAREILRGVADALPVPGIYPQSDGGLTVEWGTPERVVTIEISPEPDFFFFHLNVPTKHAEEVETKNLMEVQELVREALL